MSIYSISVSALQAAQVAIATTGHNIANASTTGYRRQTVVQATNSALATGSGFIGQGVNVSTVQRVYNEFLERQVSQAESQSSYQDQYLTNIQQINNVLGDPSAGLSTTLQNFFQSWNDLANDPTSTAARQSVLSAANTVANGINSMGQYLQTLQSGVNSDIQGTVTQINSYTTSIANLNESIRGIQSSGTQPPNDLLDQRDQLVSSLNKLVGVSVIKDSSTGDYNVFMGGVQLVAGATATSLTAKASPYDSNRTEVYDASGNLMLSGTSQIKGQLGATLDYRSQTLDVAQNSYGRIAIALADSVNALHTTGKDLSGNTGGVFFNSPDASPQVLASSNNAGSATVTATVTTSSQLTTSNYQLSYDGTNYTLTRLSDGQSWSNASISTLATTAAQGFSLSTSAAPSAGDSFLIRPTLAASTNVGVAITDPTLIAAASGTSVAGDTLDNTNALAIAKLQSNTTLVSGGNSLGSAYASLVNTIGNKTSSTQIQQTAMNNLLTQAQQAQQSVSGVNLDEEAANLVQEQQAYQAAAQVIKTANTLFSTILSIGS